MARPRVFISSTFYDLRQIRQDLFRFVRDVGYEAIINERGSIPYGKDAKLEEYCYKEIERNCDILVCMIGGRFGAQSQHGSYSITQMEIKTAIDQGKQVYIFVQKDVLAEYRTFLANSSTTSEMKYAHVDNTTIYEFIEYLYGLPNNNQLFPFETSQDLIDHLREQWAGLFQRFLAEKARQEEIRVVESLRATARTLDDLVEFLTKEKRIGDLAIDEILLTNHPAIEQIRRILGVEYRVYVSNKTELGKWLIARGYKQVEDIWCDSSDYDQWIRSSDGKSWTLKVYAGLFHPDGRLKVMTNKEWDDSWITQVEQGPIYDDPFADE